MSESSMISEGNAVSSRDITIPTCPPQIRQFTPWIVLV